MTNQFPRGSQWRRWDLHLHTPGTQKNSNFDGSSLQEQWDKFYESINNYVENGSEPNKAVAAIGVTDYLSIENYFKVKSDNQLPPCVQLILPNIEARLLPSTGKSPVNVHFIFNPRYDSKIESCFLSRLVCQKHGQPFTGSKDGITNLGKKHAEINNLKGDFHKIGIDQFLLELSAITELINGDPELRENILVVMPNSSTDGLCSLKQTTSTKQSYTRFADFIFSGNENDRQYYLGEKGTESQEDIIRQYGKLLPCIHGCDAHENKKIFAPDLDRFCWIKSDLTFEGLKQVIYEPKDRVFIGSVMPEKKLSYFCIDHVVISGNENFPSTPIYFNENLTCIIGGKSTGKSLLLHNIALTLDKKQSEEKSEKSATKVRPLSEMNVVWRDGYQSKQSSKHSEDSAPRKIVYIPQTYLNRLSDEREKTTEIDKIIQDIILQNDDSNDDFKVMGQSIKGKEQEITASIIKLCETYKQIEELNAAILEKGDPDGVSKEVERLEKEFSKATQEFQISEKDVQQYQDCTEKTQRLTRIIKTIESDKALLSKTENIIDTLSISGEDFSAFKEQIDSAITETLNAANAYWEEQKAKLLCLINDTIQKSSEELSEAQGIALKLQPQIEGTNQISQLAKSIAEEKQKLGEINDFLGKINRLKTELSTLIDSVVDAFFDFKCICDNYAANVNKRHAELPPDDLIFRVETIFKDKEFKEKLSDVLHKKKNYKQFKYRNEIELPQSEINAQVLKEIIISLVSKDDALEFISKYNLESGLRSIFGNWFNINYVVQLDDDDIYDMSPGQKALVLLRLLISLAESKCPILIDQPEDDLDNRSIFGELIEFIKKRKIDRQIIIVTHNANIVVGSDAELVIVANREGKNSPNTVHQFEYLAGSIENILPKNPYAKGILERQSIQGHICDILEGGLKAFELRRKKYHSLKIKEKVS